MAELKRIVIGTVLLVIISLSSFAQQREVIDQPQVWLGYMTSARLADNYSLWNDFHYVHEGFGVARTGITRHLPHSINVTAGYAHLWLPLGNTDPVEFKRHEHRPWAQVTVPSTIAPNLSLQNRLRWDLRYRQRVAAGEIQDGYNFNHRVRFQVILRRNLPNLKIGKVLPYISLADEVLLNFGKEITTNTFDQNRISLMIGGRMDNIQVQAGYMNRFVQGATPGRYTENHTFVVWVFHNFDLRRKTSTD